MGWSVGCAPEPLPTGRTPAVHELMAQTSDANFARVEGPRELTFPADHGAHPRHQLEWWYFTGNLEGPAGEPFGFQLTFFRRALQATPRVSESAWATAQVYLAHFTISDVAGQRFRYFERSSRGALGLAGVEKAPFAVWVESWSAQSAPASPRLFPLRLRASEGPWSLDLELSTEAAPILQGDRGYSPKGPEPGNASHYYSYPRIETRGHLQAGGERVPVTGQAWMDHEWSTSALGEGVVGWDWFSLQLSDGSNLMTFRLRRPSPDPTPWDALNWTDAAGRPLPADGVDIVPLDTWRSPHTGALYPSGWRVVGSGLDLEVRPQLRDQELNVSTAYWEGSVRVKGTRDGAAVGGRGYVELVGYADAPPKKAP